MDKEQWHKDGIRRRQLEANDVPKAAGAHKIGESAAGSVLNVDELETNDIEGAPPILPAETIESEAPQN